MNLKAAHIAWILAMEHNRLHKALTAICKANDEEYDVLKKRFFRWMYRYIVRILEAPDSTDEHFKEFLAKTLEEPTPPAGSLKETKA